MNVRVPRSCRHVAEIQKAVYMGSSLSVLVLDLFRDSEDIWFAICELLAPSIADVDCLPLLDDLIDELYPVSLSARLRPILDGSATSPFTRLGWINEAISWIEELVGEPISSKEEIRQLNLGDHFILLRLHTRGGEQYWLKATGVPNEHESRITYRLFQLASECGIPALPMPKILGMRTDWNAWLQTGAGEPAFNHPASHAARLITAATALARLQIATSGHEQSLLALGAFDQRPEALHRALPRIREQICEAMCRQISTKVPRLTDARIAVVCDLVSAALEHISQLGVPITILHGDLNAGNILWNGQIEFIDWSEAYVGPCVFSLEHLLLLNKESDDPARNRLNQEVAEAYLDVWQNSCDLVSLRRSLIYTDLLAAFATIYGRGTSHPAEDGRSDSFYSFARPVARHMERAAQKLERELAR